MTTTTTTTYFYYYYYYSMLLSLCGVLGDMMLRYAFLCVVAFYVFFMFFKNKKSKNTSPKTQKTIEKVIFMVYYRRLLPTTTTDYIQQYDDIRPTKYVVVVFFLLHSLTQKIRQKQEEEIQTKKGENTNILSDWDLTRNIIDFAGGWLAVLVFARKKIWKIMGIFSEIFQEKLLRNLHNCILSCLRHS